MTVIYISLHISHCQLFTRLSCLGFQSQSANNIMHVISVVFFLSESKCMYLSFVDVEIDPWVNGTFLFQYGTEISAKDAHSLFWKHWLIIIHRQQTAHATGRHNASFEVETNLCDSSHCVRGLLGHCVLDFCQLRSWQRGQASLQASAWWWQPGCRKRWSRRSGFAGGGGATTVQLWVLEDAEQDQHCWQSKKVWWRYSQRFIYLVDYI